LTDDETDFCKQGMHGDIAVQEQALTLRHRNIGYKALRPVRQGGYRSEVKFSRWAAGWCGRAYPDAQMILPGIDQYIDRLPCLRA